MKAERTLSRSESIATLRGTLLLKMAILWTLAKHRDRHPLKAPCLHLSQKGTSIIKKQKERAFELPREAARSFNSLKFAFEIGSGSPLPLIIALDNGYLWTVLGRVYRQTC
jgi:hypothetical protein